MRLDHYVKLGNNDIHLANILYSFLIIIGLLSLLFAMLAKTLKSDFLKIQLLDDRRS
jgi:hypothetical protein